MATLADSILLFERKVNNILNNCLITKVVNWNTTIDNNSNRLPLYYDINVGAPKTTLETLDNRVDSVPIVEVSHRNSTFRYADSISCRDEDAFFNISVIIPDSEGDINGCWQKARQLTRYAADCIEEYAVDAPDDPNGLCWQVDVLDQQPMLLSAGHGAIATLTFVARIRNRYLYSPVRQFGENQALPPVIADYYRATRVQFAYGFVDPFTQISTLTPYTIETTGTLQSIRLQDATDSASNVYAIDMETGNILLASFATDIANIQLGSMQAAFDALNSGEQIGLFVSCWKESTNEIVHVPFYLKKAAP